MSDRYIADRFLPDKAIDLVDESAARLKMEMTSKPATIDRVDRKIMQLEMEKVLSLFALSLFVLSLFACVAGDGILRRSVNGGGILSLLALLEKVYSVYLRYLR
jgi:hypothetical protein